MLPEATLVAILIIVFFADLMMKGEKRHTALTLLTTACLIIQTGVCFIAEPATVFGGLYTATAACNVMKVVLTAGTVIVCIMSQTWLNQIETSPNPSTGGASKVSPEGRFRGFSGEYYMLILSTLLGMYCMMSAGNFIMFFLGLEMASVPAACMVALDRHRNDSAEGAAKYILTATFSSAIMLYGISLLYSVAGTLYFDDFARMLASPGQSLTAYIAVKPLAMSHLPLAILGVVFFFAGLGFKLSLVPFHFWTADAYQGAPTPVTGYLSVISKGAAAFTLLIIFNKTFAQLVDVWQMLLAIVICLTITVGNLFAIRQSELKRFMAFSSISQAGYIMLAVMGDSALGTTSLTYYVLVYVVANMAVFTVINAVEHANGGKTQMSDYNGLYQTNPKLAFLMTLALFSLAGIPPFAGMFSKFFVFLAACEQGSFMAYFVVFIALINTVVSLYYYLLIVKAMYIKNDAQPLPTFKTDCYSRTALALCTLGIVAFGVCSCIFDWIHAAS